MLAADPRVVSALRQARANVARACSSHAHKLARLLSNRLQGNSDVQGAPPEAVETARPRGHHQVAEHTADAEAGVKWLPAAQAAEPAKKRRHGEQPEAANNHKRKKENPKNSNDSKRPKKRS